LKVDVHNLDSEEEQLIRATDITIAAALGKPGADLATSVAELSARCDLLHLHIDLDILDASLVRIMAPESRMGQRWRRCRPRSTQ
jgi:arginase family enzyme